jgi:hypothetical protein
MNVNKLHLKIQLPISGFGLVKDFWKWKFLSLKNDIFTKDLYNKNSLMVKKYEMIITY